MPDPKGYTEVIYSTHRVFTEARWWTIEELERFLADVKATKVRQDLALKRSMTQVKEDLP